MQLVLYCIILKVRPGMEFYCVVRAISNSMPIVMQIGGPAHSLDALSWATWLPLVDLQYHGKLRNNLLFRFPQQKQNIGPWQL